MTEDSKSVWKQMADLAVKQRNAALKRAEAAEKEVAVLRDEIVKLSVSHGLVRARAEAAEDMLRHAIYLIDGPLVGAEWKQACNEFVLRATAALEAKP